MPVKTEFERIFREHFNHEMPLSQVPDTCSTLDVSVFSFDEIKYTFCDTLGIRSSSPCSVDALYIPSQPNNCLFFIEMKRFGSGLTCEQYIGNHLRSEKLRYKIIDSVFVLFALVGSYSDKCNILYSRLLNQSAVFNLKTILLVDLNEEDMLTLSLATLDRHQISLNKRIDGQIEVCNDRTIQRFLN